MDAPEGMTLSEVSSLRKTSTMSSLSYVTEKTGQQHRRRDTGNRLAVPGAGRAGGKGIGDSDVQSPFKTNLEKTGGCQAQHRGYNQ